ncbi:hypothetical protein Pmani_031930 [Petrolisthes manimaculis]|uniref:Transposase n=1 Tax=Petrolisthes manimaculis TaxID=1843537 RepID=A0AAE1NUR5_9EUCA|nr:hypothetical protein Pmani_031930 [Petrolisthes manimaculis]
MHLPNSIREPAGMEARRERLVSRRRRLLVPVLEEGLLDERNDNAPEMELDAAIPQPQEEARGDDAHETQEALLNEGNDDTSGVVDGTVQPAQDDSTDTPNSISTAVCWSCCICIPRHDQLKSELVNLKSANAILSEKINEMKNNDTNLRNAYLLLQDDSTKKCDDFQKKLTKLELEGENLRKINIHLQELVTKYELQNSKINIENNVIEEYDKVAARMKDVLSTYFTETQIDFFLTSIPIRKWSNDDIARALTFRAISPNGYKHVREQMKLPFPSASTLKRWTKGHIFQEGLLDIVLNLMKGKSETMTKAECACVLSFDEMKVTESWEFRRIDESVMSPHRYVQVVIVRGIIGCWKQIVYFNYDTKMTHDLLQKIIIAVEESGYEVHATVCDMGSTNSKMLKDIGISENHNTFLNPYDNSRVIHAFLDVPHLIKLVRNHFLDHGFYNINTKKEIRCDPVKKLSVLDNGNLKLAPKLTDHHLQVKGPQRQRVKYAVQLLSGTVSKAMKFLGEHGKLESETLVETSEFIQLINDWFDVFNSSIRTDSAGKRHSFMKSDKQIKVINDTVTLIKCLRVTGKYLPFQKGIVISSKSVVTLYESLKERFNISYILTRRLNQDILEHFFSVIRQMGRCYDHPTPLSFQQRLKLYIMGKDTAVLASNTNTSEIETTSMIASGIQEFVGSSHEIDSSLTSDVFTQDLGTFVDDIDDENIEPEFTFPETEAIDHFLGFVVHKFQSKYPDLGNVLQDTANNSSWDAYITRGGLKVMKPQFRECFLRLEGCFREYHGTSLREGKAAIENVLQLLTTHTGIPMEVARYYVRCRIYFRIKQLNNPLKNKNSYKKMKKIIN